MKKNSIFKYYRVFKNETAVTEISTNNFKPVFSGPLKTELLPGIFTGYKTPTPNTSYHLPKDEEMFYGYSTKATAMRMAKAGALTCIGRMIEEVTQGIKRLKDYRTAHFNDLNSTLLEGNIRKLERDMYIK